MDNIKKTTITVSRSAYWSVGVRLWFVLQATDSTRFHRWSMEMNSTDAVLLLARDGDVIDIEYLDSMTDIQNNTQNNVIVTAEFAKK